jgi:hypothetical protein
MFGTGNFYQMKEPLVSELTIPHTSPLYNYPKDMSPETDVIENISLPNLLLLHVLTNS